MTEDEFERFMNSEMGGKGLIWLNYFKDIKDANPEGGDEATASIKKYKGQWRSNDLDIWEGFGVI